MALHNLKNKIIFQFALLSFPLFSHAQLLTKTGTLGSAAKNIVITILIPMVFMLSLLFFAWGIAKFIWQEGQGKEDGKKIMIWGIIALFVASSVWGIVGFLRSEFNINNNSNFELPKFGNFFGGDSPIENPEP